MPNTEIRRGKYWVSDKARLKRAEEKRARRRERNFRWKANGG